MDIELVGLTHKQKVFCDIMWTISSREGVAAFIKSLPKRDQVECHTLIELMQLAFMDEIESTHEADCEIKRIMLNSKHD